MNQDSNNELSQGLASRQPYQRWLWFTGLMLLLAIAGTTIRIVRDYGPPGPFDPSRQGLCDFHNGLYYPARAVVDGVSPYGGDYDIQYPVSRSIPFYSPSVLLMHYPIAALPLRIAEVVYVFFSYGVLLAIAWFVTKVARGDGWPVDWRWTVIIAALLACSRGGHITIYNGYFTLELILATFVAIHYAPRRHWIAAVALAVVAIKPTYILPLGFLLFARGNLRSLWCGALVTAIVTLGPMTYLAWHLGEANVIDGWRQLVHQIAETQTTHRAVPSESPVLSWTRIDALALVAKWMNTDPPQWVYLTSMIGLNVPSMLVLNRRRRRDIDDGLLGVTGLIITSSMLISVYHQFYDALLWIAPLIGLCLLPWSTGMKMGLPANPKPMVIVLAIGLAVPLFNYATANVVLSRLPEQSPWIDVLTSINATILLLVWGLSLTYFETSSRVDDEPLSRSGH